MKQRTVSHWLTAVGFLLIAMSAGLARAQAVANAQMSGVVTDPSGAAIPNATIIATQTDTHTTRTVQSGSDGTFILPGLAIGPYKLQVEAKGIHFLRPDRYCSSGWGEPQNQHRLETRRDHRTSCGELECSDGPDGHIICVPSNRSGAHGRNATQWASTHAAYNVIRRRK